MTDGTGKMPRMCAAPLPLRVATLLACSILLSVGCSTKKEAGLSEEAIRFNILGAAQLGQTKWAEAETAFRRALELRPDDPLLLTNTAIAVYQQQRGATETVKNRLNNDLSFAFLPNLMQVLT